MATAAASVLLPTTLLTAVASSYWAPTLGTLVTSTSQHDFSAAHNTVPYKAGFTVSPFFMAE